LNAKRGWEKKAESRKGFWLPLTGMEKTTARGALGGTMDCGEKRVIFGVGELLKIP